MTDIPSTTPGGPSGTREYEVQILVPNKHRDGERWRPLGEPYSSLDKSMWAIDDLVSSMTSVIGDGPAHAWADSHVRVMEKVTTVEYGKEMPRGF